MAVFWAFALLTCVDSTTFKSLKVLLLWGRFASKVEGCVRNATTKHARLFGLTERPYNGLCTAKQYMHALRSHFGPLLVVAGEFCLAPKWLLVCDDRLKIYWCVKMPWRKKSIKVVYIHLFRWFNILYSGLFCEMRSIFRAPQRRVKIRGMNKMSASIIC